MLDSAQALLEAYGVRTVSRIIRARSAGPAIVEDAIGRSRGDHRRRGTAPSRPQREADLRAHRRLRLEAQPDPRARGSRPTGRVITRVFAVVLVVLGVGGDRPHGPRGRGGRAGPAPRRHARARRGACGCTFLAADGTEAARPATRPRRPVAGCGRLRGDRFLALLRPRHHRALRPRLHAVGPPARRRALPARGALVRGGDDGDSRDRWSRDLRAPRVQRPARLSRRLGALPRLPDRDRARRPLRPPLPRARARLGVADG